MTPAPPDETNAAGRETPRRLFSYVTVFGKDPRIKRILELSGWPPMRRWLRGIPKAGDFIGVWGNSPLAKHGERIAERTGATLVRFEDALLRSVLTGRDGEPPLGLQTCLKAMPYDSRAPSDLEEILASHPLDDSALLARARDAMAWMAHAHVSKYNDFDRDLPLPDPPYVLVIDQTRGDASIRLGAADAGTFKDMLVAAQLEHPGLPVHVKTHPETMAGHRSGHFGPEDETGQVHLITDPVDPWALMQGAVAVYTVSSGMGFEAIIAGHKPRVFGQPFYSGWGLTEDENPVARRTRKLTRNQLFAGAMMLYPTWYDPFHDRLCEVEQVIATLEARARAAHVDRHGHVAAGMRLWKRRAINRVFGANKALIFRNGKAALPHAKKTGRSLLVWAHHERELGDIGGVRLRRIEDGFLRSRGLGADLVTPLSLVVDDLGIYYDPTRESRLERQIAAATRLPDVARKRAERLLAGLIKARLSKYNLPGTMPDLPRGRRILVPGQVEDDASILLGCAGVRTNFGLLEAARIANPGAVIVYKPHPDVETGLRPGRIDPAVAGEYADVIADHADPIALIEACDEVWTLTSLMGFEALIRGKPVTCLGAPFYAGWGLTNDLGEVPDRRQARPDVIALAHAALIDYPRYYDPVTRSICPVEVAVDRLADGIGIRDGLGLRLLAKAQGALASYAHLWR